MFAKSKFTSNYLRLTGILLVWLFQFMVFATPCYSQSLTSDVLSTRLCKIWKIDKIVQGEKVASSESLISDFVLIIHPDHSVEQGMSPMG